jgi:hypothetical protein
MDVVENGANVSYYFDITEMMMHEAKMLNASAR